MPTIVAIDIETTGLDDQNDAITEIGAVRFNGRRVESEWTTLVNPGRAIPPFITQLTGITNEMVRNAPPIKAVTNQLADFVGNAPVIGHNVRFDLGFLQRQGILRANEALDTYELASVLMPTAGRYNLGALGQAMGVLLPATHRALDDARVTHAIYVKLIEMAAELPIELIAEFVRHGEPLPWGAAGVFQEVLRAKARQPIAARRATDSGALFTTRAEKLAAPPMAVENPQPLDTDEVAALLEYGGPFARYFGNYEYRQQQVEMLRAVTKALSDGQHLMVEAGTGTGKSFAYLVPAALFAMLNNTRVVISTNTINLQDQLIKKDIPDLRDALQIDLRAAVLKGRGNYLCPRRLESMRQRGPVSVDELRVLCKILVWLQSSDSGDRNEINLNGPAEREVWMRLSAEDEGCKAEVCQSRTGGSCPFYRARQAAINSHLLIVNHALLLADVATGSKVLPEYDYLIIDEGHHMEAATTSALSFRATQIDLIRLLRELGGTSTGILSRMLHQMQQILRPSDLAGLHQQLDRATDLLFRLEHGYQAFFRSVDDFLAECREGRPVGAYGQQERILDSSRTLPTWTEVEIAWDTAHESATLLLNLLAEVYKFCGETREEGNEEMDDALENLSSAYRRLAEADTNLHGFVAQPQQGLIYWAEIAPNSHSISLQIAPLNVGPLMEQFVWHEKTSVILTSATLTANEGFDYIRNRLNADEADELQLGSPFDYETSALLYLANDIPEPADANGYQRGVETAIVRLAKATNGRMLVLFTSYAQLKRTSQNITGPLGEAGITVYEQGEGASANTLLENFREADKAVLLGTRSFWEGVDIPGEALSVLVIVKLPFDVPSDPIIAARSETFEDAFNEYQLPEAILRFRQGFGRLIRTQSDRGIVAILDRRILTKRYGKLFIESLPACKIVIRPVQELPATAARWLNL
jgi:DNA polymerase-3 subunit epsilon/ATP-dependent DNA helicase DinG